GGATRQPAGARGARSRLPDRCRARRPARSCAHGRTYRADRALAWAPRRHHALEPRRLRRRRGRPRAGVHGIGPGAGLEGREAGHGAARAGGMIETETASSSVGYRPTEHVEFVLLVIPDVNGSLRGKALRPDAFEDAVRHGTVMTDLLLALDPVDV